MMASSSAITTRNDMTDYLSEPIEEFVLAGLEFDDFCVDVGPMLAQRVDVSLRIARFERRSGGFGHERPQCLIFGVIGEMRELLVDHGEFSAQ